MVENARKSYDGFMGTQYAKLLGLVLAFVVSFAILALLGTDYGLYMFVGIILYIIPRLFHVKNYKVMAVLGVGFLLVSTLVGGLLFTAPAMNAQTTEDMEGNGFEYIFVDDEGDGKYRISVTVTSGDTYPVLHYGPVGSTCFSDVRSLNVHMVKTEVEKEIEMEYDPINGWYMATVDLPDGKPWYIYFTTDNHVSDRGLVTANISDAQITSFAIMTNFSTVLIPIITFFIILCVMMFFNRKVEHVREEMEAEGRLYPQGMGRCKECGMVVLPGETVCRKCGAVIDVPEEFRRKPAPQPAPQTHFECSECGASVPADSKVCPNCGASFDEDDDE